jgi:hypothetical protein
MYAPSLAEIGAAIDRGVALVGGMPALVGDGDSYAVPDLLGRGYWVGWRQLRDGVGVAYHGTQEMDRHTLSVGGLAVSSRDEAMVLSAIAAVDGADRHGAAADGARKTAGQIAMRIRDAMVRARLLDLLDAWSGVMGTVVDGSWDGRDGVLAQCAAGRDHPVLLLGVVCPSTGRRYVHPVPLSLSSAASARRWLMGLEPGDPAPDVET